jgi:hypothetical protein
MVLSQPLGDALLALIALGLLCFAGWRLAQALLDADRRGKTPSSLLGRFALAASALFYIAFAWVAFGVLLGSDRRQSSEHLAHEWTAWLLAQPAGRWAAGAIGAGFVIAGAATAARGLRSSFGRNIEAGKSEREIVTALGVAGFLARGFVVAVIGVFLIFAALRARSSEAKGLAGALEALQGYPHGGVILALTSAGFLAFGLFEIAQAAWRRIEAPAIAK